mmetsp:Transcript_3915/g.9015  ORF Transcript_3915/g.9015 Transcript_3915/m.9015 type:complete len:202 (+) Transcript_3915:349-954(+)
MTGSLGRATAQTLSRRCSGPCQWGSKGPCYRRATARPPPWPHRLQLAGPWMPAPAARPQPPWQPPARQPRWRRWRQRSRSAWPPARRRAAPFRAAGSPRACQKAWRSGTHSSTSTTHPRTSASCSRCRTACSGNASGRRRRPRRGPKLPQFPQLPLTRLHSLLLWQMCCLRHQLHLPWFKRPLPFLLRNSWAARSFHVAQR